MAFAVEEVHRRIRQCLADCQCRVREPRERGTDRPRLTLVANGYALEDIARLAAGVKVADWLEMSA